MSIDRIKQRSFRVIQPSDGYWPSRVFDIGIMALLVWLVLAASVVIDAFGLNDWLNEMSMSAHRYWSSGVTDRGPQSSKERQNMLRNIGAGLRK